MRVEAKNERRTRITFTSETELPAVRAAVAKNLGVVARVGFFVRSYVAEIGIRGLMSPDVDNLEQRPLSVTIPVNRLPAVQASLDARVTELSHLSTVVESDHPDFHRAYGAPEYLESAQSASQVVSAFITHQQ